MCEQVILNEEIENEKVIKHRRNIKIGRYAMDRYADGTNNVKNSFKGLKHNFLS